MARLTPETERFLRKAVAGLPFLKRSEAKDELRAHLEDAIQQRVAQGTLSVNFCGAGKAVAALGDAAVLNRQLLRSHCGYRWPLLLLRSKFYKWAIQSAGGQVGYKGRRESTNIGSQFDRVRVEQTIARAERKLASRGPSYRIHARLGDGKQCPCRARTQTVRQGRENRRMRTRAGTCAGRGGLPRARADTLSGGGGLAHYAFRTMGFHRRQAEVARWGVQPIGNLIGDHG